MAHRRTSFYRSDLEDLLTEVKQQVEQQRLNIHHEVFLKLLHDQLYIAPLKDPRRILDIGTGSGIWAVEMADKFPEAEVIGTDLRYVSACLCTY
jgi:methylase of polypeptide subunit release factors